MHAWFVGWFPFLHNMVNWTRLPGAGIQTQGPKMTNEIQCARVSYITVIRLICLTKRPRNRPLGVRSSQTPGNLLDSFNLTVATVNLLPG
jgi:hypothetical protein